MTEPNALVITRILDAPIERVWQAWTDPELVRRWWGPHHFSAPEARIDLRVGGRYVFAMLAPPEMGGQVSYSAGEYLRIEPPHLLEFTQHLSDPEGNPIDPVSIGMPPDFPPEIRTTVSFRARGQVTEVVVTERSWAPGQMAVYSELGMRQSLDKMQAALDEAG